LVERCTAFGSVYIIEEMRQARHFGRMTPPEPHYTRCRIQSRREYNSRNRGRAWR